MIQEDRTERKVKEGIVISNKMDKTVVVRVDRTLPHPKYGKVITRGKKYYAHSDAKHDLGDKVTIAETKPLSKMKRWRVVQDQA